MAINKSSAQLKPADFWREELKGAPKHIQLPTDFNRKQDQPFQKGEYTFVLDRSLVNKLTGMETINQPGSCELLLTAFSLLLYRYSSQDDFLVALSCNRLQTADATAANAFTKIVPIRFLVSDETTFAGLLTFVQNKVGEAIENGKLSFDELFVQESGNELPVKERLPNVSFQYLSQAELAKNPLSGGETNGEFDLAFEVVEEAHNFACKFTFNRALYQEATISRAAGHILTLLHALTSGIATPVLSLPLLTKQEEQQILTDWNNTKVEYPRELCIHQLFELQAEKTPDRVAVVFEKEQLTYAELNAEANRLAHYLAGQGACEDQTVALFVERGLNIIIGLLAISKTGATYLPLDPIYPRARLSLIVTDAAPVILLTQKSLTASAPETSAKMIFMDDAAAYSTASPENLSFGNPEKAAYILYTSGSTGKPKGVPITQRAVVNLVNSMRKQLEFTAEDILLAVTTISFDIAELEMYLPLFNGARLVIASQEATTDMELLAKKINECGATIFQATPVTFKMLMISSWKGKKDLKLIIGGEALSKELVRELLPICSGVWNSYGPTETAIYSVVRNLTMEETDGDGYVPIGRPLDNTTLYVLNKLLVPVPVGIPGELYIGGDGLSSGYLNLPAMTDERFIPNPFGKEPNEKIYKTGDLVQYFGDGNLVFLNRVDSQVKIRGFRIELGEIESAIAQYPAIKDKVVIVREDIPGDKKLVGYIIPEDTAVPDLQELRNFLKSKLPDYMVPVSFMVMEQFPVTLNGKVDRKLLPAPAESTHPLVSNFSLPQGETEQKIAFALTEIFRTKSIGRDDNFFDLGGNSLLAAMLISKINKELNIRISLRTIFDKQTVCGMAEEIDKLLLAKTGTDIAQTIHHIDAVSNIFPASPGQKRLWFLENFEPGGRAYNMPFDYAIKGALDVPMLEKSFQVLQKRHLAISTVIRNKNGEPVQEVLETEPYQLEVVDLENLTEQEKTVVTEKHSMENEMHVFDVETGPLFISKLLKFNATEWLLLINMHHSVTDGWSMKNLVNELGLLYSAFSQNREPELPPLPITYADFAIWQNDWLKSPSCQKELDFWKEALRGAPDLLQLPLDFQRPRNQTYDGDEVQFTISRQQTEQLQHFAQQHNGSMFVTLLSIFNTLISRYTTQEEFLVGVPISGRVFEEQASLVGMLINNFPLRVTPLEQMTFMELFEQSKQKFYLAFEHQNLPIDRIVEELKVARTPNISPLFQVMFNYLDMFDETIMLDESSMEMIDKRRHISQFDLTLHIYEAKNTLNCILEYNTNIFSRSRMERMAGHFMQLVNSLMTNPKQKLKTIPLLTEPERQLILGDWNNTVVDFPEQKCIFQLFEEQVLKTPERTAISDDKNKVTYTALNEKANKLARYLHKSGAVEGSLVAICIERSTDLLVALLAIQKAGCTYIPLDPIYPKDRLALILEDGNPVVLLTEKKLLENLPETAAKNVFIEETTAYQDESGTNTNYAVSPDMVAYLIYTSGSTGKPKGVQIQHRALVNFIASMAKQPGIRPEDVLLAVTTISFDIAGLEMYLPVICGATIFVASQETSMNPDLLIQKIEENKATILQATPVTFRMLNSAEWKGARNLKILCGGEAMPKELAYDLVGKCGELWNMYGPTETTVWSTVEKVEVDENDKTGYINLGKPIDNTFIYVLNTEFQPVPIGYPGELFIGGDGLAKGYFNLPEMTRDKFLPDPFSNRPGARMYRTGDLVQQTEEGKLEFLNRVDSQVKIRGFRIELGEIESALTQYPTISDNVVLVREDTPGDKRLVAYIIKKENQETDLSDLRQFLKTKIPDYMVPVAYVFIDQFPLTPNGKIDRKALPSPMETVQQEEKAYVAPTTETEKKLAEIWAEVLKIKRVSIDENFFEIGGHSMLAVTLMVKIEKVLGVRLPLAVLFDHSTIQDMALLLEKKEEAVSWGSLVPIRSKGSKRPLYLVHGAGLNLLLYTTIVAHLDPDQPVFGLQAKGLDGVDEPLYTIEEIAAYYNEEILKIDKSGSYALAGFSMGGQIAYEMARQLVEAGKKVSLLGVFDTVSENASDMHIPFLKRYILRIDRLLHQVTWIIGTFLKMPGKKKFEFAAAKWKSIKQRITKDDYKLKPEGVSLGKQSELPKYLHKVHRANWIAMEKYILPPYPGKLTLFRAMDQKFYIKEPVCYGWDEFVKEVIILHIPGEHSTIFAPPNDKLFAEALQKCLDEREL